jgi:uncharacterized surface protein with fasciclin (FAS1) repeats
MFAAAHLIVIEKRQISADSKNPPLETADFDLNFCCVRFTHTPPDDRAGDPTKGNDTMLRTAVFAIAATTALSAPAFAADLDIVDTAVGAGTFGTLVAAVTAADLVDTLKSEGPFTVFAPTDEAFAALPEGTVESLLLPENKDQLVAILTYHVVAGQVMSTDLVDDMKAATVQGGEITIDLDNGVMINDANVVTADIETSNGVIHVIDKVILPAS